MESEKIYVAVVCGPTASGKTDLGVRLAKEANGEIISADSMQIYKGMEIASAKPTCEEMGGIRHHLMNFLSPTTAFSVADYVELARKCIEDIHSRGKLPIIVGGQDCIFPLSWKILSLTIREAMPNFVIK